METVGETDPKKLGTVVINDTIDAKYVQTYLQKPQKNSTYQSSKAY